MRVLMLFNDYLQAGGERVSVATEHRALVSSGVDTHLLSIGNDLLAQRGAVGKALATFPSRGMATLVSEQIASFKPDIVHAQNLFPQLGAGAISALQKAKLPWVRTIRNYRKGCLAGTFVRDGKPCRDCAGRVGKIPGIVHGCYQGSRAASVGAANYAFWDSKEEAAHPPGAYILISRALHENIAYKLHKSSAARIVYNAVDADPSLTTSSMADRTFHVAFVGRLTAEKGIETVLWMAKAHPNYSFAIAGRGPLEHLVEAACADYSNITYFSDLDSIGAAALMGRSRTVVVPSRWEEPFGRVAAEALAAGAIPIVSDLGGLPEIVAGLDSMQVVDSADPVRWADRVAAMLSRPLDELDELSSAGSARWAIAFSPNASASGLTSVYEEVLRGRS